MLPWLLYLFQTIPIYLSPSFFIFLELNQTGGFAVPDTLANYEASVATWIYDWFYHKESKLWVELETKFPWLPYLDSLSLWCLNLDDQCCLSLPSISVKLTYPVPSFYYEMVCLLIHLVPSPLNTHPLHWGLMRILLRNPVAWPCWWKSTFSFTIFTLKIKKS